KLIFKVLTRLHMWIYRLSGGKVWNRMMGQPVVILTTKGRKSGRPWAVPLLTFKDQEDYILVASNGGQNFHPAWYLNLQANPDVIIELEGQKQTARAEDVKGAERERLWGTIVSKAPAYKEYEQKTEREIPVVRLKVG
ncbi:MAG TPA: nitroreductase family deazaflavin-dependent oxidoreductase, partial [Anaerolineae bacterium]|nr:nitroreductase family deazaflavin-dependent oxidoreductase [Anaerolineae bacterium]